MNTATKDEEQIAKMRRFFLSEKVKDISYRLKALVSLEESILKHENEIYGALKNDLNKPDFECLVSETGLVLNEINYAKKNLRKWSKPKKVKTPLGLKPGRSFVYPEPLGVCLIIGPWNYPFNLVLMPLIGAIASGNCVILKPSENAPNVQEVINKIITSCFDAKHVCVMSGDASFTKQLLQNKFDHIFFTGNQKIGAVIMEQAAKNITPVTLELGGKNPCIIDENTDLKNTSKAIAWGKFFNAGQSCLAVDYVLVKPAIKQEFMRFLIESITMFYGQNPKDSNNLGRIINKNHFNRLIGLLEDGNIVCGGDSDQNSKYIAPTIIDEVKWDDKIMEEEIFGPILPVLVYDHLEEVIDFLQRRPQSLTLYLFSKNKRNQNKVINSTISGSVCINSTLTHFISKTLPFGGRGQSGLGAYHGYHSFKTFSHYKSVYKKPKATGSNMSYPPYTLNIDKFKKVFKIANR